MEGQHRFKVVDTKTGRLLTDAFVLFPKRDPVARAALKCYSELTTNKVLAERIRKWLKSLAYGKTDA